jgi:hypothetical protein
VERDYVLTHYLTIGQSLLANFTTSCWVALTGIPWGIHHNHIEQTASAMSFLGFNQFVKIKGEDVGRYWDAILLVLLETRYSFFVQGPGFRVSSLAAAILK